MRLSSSAFISAYFYFWLWSTWADTFLFSFKMMQSKVLLSIFFYALEADISLIFIF